MAEKKAQNIIKLYDRQWALNSNFRSLWQETADLMFPRESTITETLVPGSKRTDGIYDTTGIIDSKEMADGMLSALIPTGEYFFQWNVSSDNPYGTNDDYVNWCSRATDKQHRALFASNFMQMASETMRSLICFGTGNQYSDWSMKLLGLNFKDFDIAMYIVWLDDDGNIEGQALKFPYTARQAYGRWGEKAGEEVVKAAKKPEDQENIFHFIHIVRPNQKRNMLLSDNKNWSYESAYVNVKEEITVSESGYKEFPYHIPRWMVTSGEIMGRGVGTEILPQMKVLNRAMSDFIDLCNRHGNPPREVLESFDGELDVTPGANNIVQEIPSFKAMETLTGNFPVAEKEILLLRSFVDKAFLKDAFSPITDLKGDRRTTVEIRERKLEGLKRVGQPVGRIQSSWFEPMLRRTLMLLIRHGEIKKPPPGLELLEIEYLGLMSNALSSGQSTAFQQGAAVTMELEETFPGIKDNLNYDEGVRHLYRSLGIKAEHINTKDQVSEIRRQRTEMMEQEKALEAAQVAAQGYSQTTGAPEEGSPAGALMEAANA